MTAIIKMAMSDFDATGLKICLFGNNYRGMKARNVFHACKQLMDELPTEIYCASNNLSWLFHTARLNPGYIFALREGTAQQVCQVIMALAESGVTGETAMISVVEKSIKPIKF